MFCLTPYWGVEIGGVKSGDTVVVLGCGPIGLTAIKWALFKGAKRVIAVDNVGYRLKHASSYKGVETINFEDYDNTGELYKRNNSWWSRYSSRLCWYGKDGKK